MRDITHKEQIERWARYVKDNPTKWKSKIKPFLDAQIIMARRFQSNLSKTPEGIQKLKRLRKISSSQ